MTKFHYEDIRCPHCLNEEKIPVWDIVDISEDADLKEKIMLKELQTFECQNCNHFYVLDKPFLYIDPEQELMIFYAAKFKDVLLKPEARNDKGELKELIRKNLPLDFGINVEDFTLRIVSDYNSLIEKMHVFDYELNDFIIEVLKLSVKINPPKIVDEKGNQTVRQISLIYFVGIEDDKFVFQTYSDDQVWRQILLEPSVYKQAQAMLKNKLPEGKSWELVDELGASIYLNNFPI